MKSLIVEPYTEMPKGCYLLQQKLELSIIILAIYIASLVVLIWSIVDPFALTLLFLPTMLLSFYATDNGNAHLFRRSRVYFSFHYEWLDEDIMEKHSLYREKVMEYLNFIRDGGKQSAIIESQLIDWLKEVEKEIEDQKIKDQWDAARMFHFKEQLNDYREWKKDHESLY